MNLCKILFTNLILESVDDTVLTNISSDVIHFRDSIEKYSYVKHEWRQIWKVLIKGWKLGID